MGSLIGGPAPRSLGMTISLIGHFLSTQPLLSLVVRRCTPSLLRPPSPGVTPSMGKLHPDNVCFAKGVLAQDVVHKGTGKTRQ